MPLLIKSASQRCVANVRTVAFIQCFNNISEPDGLEFLQESYSALEDIGESSFAVRVCIITTALESDRIVTLETVSGTAQGF